MTLRRQVSLVLLLFPSEIIIAQKKLKFKTYFVEFEFSNSFLRIPTLNHSYASTSRIVSRAALRAGKMLASAERARTSPNQMA
jgi:hypothetical protein